MKKTKALTKNLANCTPREFLYQTNKIRKAAERWLDATNILNIRRNVPELNIPDGAKPDEVSEIMKKHKEELSKAAKRNFSDILDSVLEKNPDETLELLALACFVEPDEVDEYSVHDYLVNMTEIMNDGAVVSFFTSLMQLGQIGTSIA